VVLTNGKLYALVKVGSVWRGELNF
jgi:hypothetical protein